MHIIAKRKIIICLVLVIFLVGFIKYRDFKIQNSYNIDRYNSEVSDSSNDLIPLISVSDVWYCNPNTYALYIHDIGEMDNYKWSFDSTNSPIQVIVLTQEEYNNFYNIYVSEFTATLESPTYRGSGEWQPPHKDMWHILYYNVGSYYTQVIITESVELGKYFPWDFVTIGVILGVIILICIISISISRSKRKREQYIEEKATQLTLEKQQALKNKIAWVKAQYYREKKTLQEIANYLGESVVNVRKYLDLAKRLDDVEIIKRERVVKPVQTVIYQKSFDDLTMDNHRILQAKLNAIGRDINDLKERYFEVKAPLTLTSFNCSECGATLNINSKEEKFIICEHCATPFLMEWQKE